MIFDLFVILKEMRSKIKNLFSNIHSKSKVTVTNKSCLLTFFIFFSLKSFAALPQKAVNPLLSKEDSASSLQNNPSKKQKTTSLSLKEKLKLLEAKQTGKTEHFIFDIPVTYNDRVSYWIDFFQNRGRNFFRNWLEKASKYMPDIQKELKKAGLPTDLAYMVMIESGFSSTATSSAQAVGPWQFISSTGRSYGLRQTHWLDERRNIQKSTQAAIKYLKTLHREFGSWYLVAASYNMGESGLRRRIKKYNTNDYWELVRRNALPLETQDYVPKILAAMMISKAPSLYGFRNLTPLLPIVTEKVEAPSGTDLDKLADHLGVTRKHLRDLNPELLLGYIPRNLSAYTIQVPHGAKANAQEFFKKSTKRYVTQK